MKDVIIGIVSKHYASYKNERTDTFIRDEVKQAIFDNGGIAIGILPTEKEINYVGDNWKDNLSAEERENLIAQIKLCDGIIMQGGIETDNYEIIIAKYCYDNNIPVLGICAGQNNIVRALGGATYKIPNPEKHNRSSEQYVHTIKIDKNSKFFSFIGKEEILVNSRHKRTVKDCPKLNKVAFCEDGYADVIEAEDKDVYIGVRFHPESLYRIDKNMNNIFSCFIEKCKKKKRGENQMKNILIMGIGRAGKTTLSNMIKEKYNEYNIIHSDSIKWAMIRAAGKEGYYRENIKEQKEFEHGEYFQRVLLEFFNSCIRNDINKHGYILESGQLTPKIVKEYIDFKNTKVIALGHGDVKKEDIIKLCRDHDKPEDWSFGLSDDILEAHAEKWAETNEVLREECPKYGIEFIDTSENRKEILNQILLELSKDKGEESE